MNDVAPSASHPGLEPRIEALLSRMTLAEKIGQMCQASGSAPEHKAMVRRGELGSLLNVIEESADEFQRVAREESRLGIPLILGLDVIHGYRTILPIPLGQAASFNPALVRNGARVAAREAAAAGVNWTFAPMVDIARDPRWGRIAESAGEDPCLAAAMGAAAVEGFQGDLLDGDETGGAPAAAGPAAADCAIPGIAACAKHFAGYGAAEAGRDYNTTLIPERTLRNVYLPPFKACVEAEAATLMSAFNELNDVPITANAFVLRQVLKKEWGFEGFVVSDWNAVAELIQHGYSADAASAAEAAVKAGVDMDMVSWAYRDHLARLVDEGQVPLALIDDAVRRVLRVKFQLGLFDQPAKPRPPMSVILSDPHLQIAYRAAVESLVLLKNEAVLPIAAAPGPIAVIGPLADAPAEQLGCWACLGDPAPVRTPLAALRQVLGADSVIYEAGLDNCRGTGTARIEAAVQAAHSARLVLLFVGEDAGLSGESHCRAHLDLPGSQEELVKAVAATGTPVVAVVMAGRPLLLDSILPHARALLWAWHPGTMGGPAIVDVLFGRAMPSGRLPVCFPRAVGQVPIYYAAKNTGRPPADNRTGGPQGTPENPVDFGSIYMDMDHRPLFPFGFGLAYTTFDFSRTRLSRSALRAGETCTASVTITNTGDRRGAAVVQLYIRDLVASATRPIKEMKAFEKLWLDPGESREVTFRIGAPDLAFCDANMEWRAEPGKFHVWAAPDSATREYPPAELELVS